MSWIKTEFRSSLSTDKVSSLIGYHFNKRCKCCELSLFDESLLAKGKLCIYILMTEARAINISILKQLYFFVYFLN